MFDRPDSTGTISSSYHDGDLSKISEPMRRVLSRRAALKGVSLLGLAGIVTTLLAACSVPSGNSSGNGTPTPDNGGDSGSGSNSNGSSSGSDDDNGSSSGSDDGGDDTGGDDDGGSSSGGDDGDDGE